MRDDDHPTAIALGHNVICVAFAVRPIGTVTGFGPGHGPVVVDRSQFGCEVADRLHRVRAMRVLVESGKERRVLLLNLPAAMKHFATPVDPLDVIGQRSTHAAGIVDVPASAEASDDLLYRRFVFCSARISGLACW